MADRYWVGGTGSWSDTNKWSASSGGAGGASVPTSADNVIFDAGSDAGGTFVVTVDGTSGSPSLCADFTASGLDFGMTLTMGATAFLDCYGSFTLPITNFSVSASLGATIRFRATTTGKTITTNGVSLSNISITLNGAGGEWTLNSAYTSTATITFDNGTFNTNNFNVTIGQFLSVTSNTRSLNFGSSTITLSSTNLWSLASTGLTLNAGTSTIVCLSASPNFGGGGLTYYNVNFTNLGSGTKTITGANTFNNLSVSSLSATGISQIALSANQTINGTLTLGTANTAIRRMFMRSDAVGTARTLTVATMATLADVDFRDITISGAASPVSGTRLGNCGGNSGITFDAGKTVYRVGTGNWSATQWSLSSGGSVNVNNFPLAQDTAIFDTGTTTGTHTVDAAWNIGTLDMSALTVAVTLATGTTTPSIYGSITLDADVTLSGTGALTIAGRTTQTITSAGKTWTQPFTVNSPSGSLQLVDDLNNGSTLTFTVTQGRLDLNNNDLTTGVVSSTGGLSRGIDFANGTLNVQAASFTVSGSNFTTSGTGSISMNSASSKTFAGGGFTYTCALNQGGSGTLVITGANTFDDITNTNATASTITFPNTTTSVSAFSAEGTVGNLLTLSRTGASGTFTLAYIGSSRVDSDYLSISNSEATPSNTWYAGTNSTDGGGNTGWTFTAAPVITESNIERLAERGAVIVGQSKQTSTAGRLGGAGQIEADIVRYKTQFSSRVSGLTVKGRLINKARE